MQADDTLPVPTRLLSTYPCHDMIWKCVCLVPISARGGWLHNLAPGPAERPLVACTVYDDVIPLFPGYVGNCE